MKKQGNQTKENKKTVDENPNGEEKLPGYPHYPDSEDIMNQPQEKISIDLENMERPLAPNMQTMAPIDDELQLKEGTSADVRKEELESFDIDEDLKDRVFPVDMAASDLVVPGAELDDAQEESGNEDEENNFYSQADNK
jgi:hypothetical protein